MDSQIMNVIGTYTRTDTNTGVAELIFIRKDYTIRTVSRLEYIVDNGTTIIEFINKYGKYIYTITVTKNNLDFDHEISVIHST